MALLTQDQVLADAAVILSLLFVSIMLLWVYFASPILAIGPLAPHISTSLRVGITVTATVFMMVVSARIQHALMRTLEDRLQGLARGQYCSNDDDGGDRRSTAAVEEGEDDRDQRKERMAQLDREWRATLRIDSFAEKFYSFRIFATFLISTLITTSIIMLLTPTLTTRPVPYDPIIPDASIGGCPVGEDRACVGYCASWNMSTYYTVPKSAYHWQLEANAGDDHNQSIYTSAYDEDCAPSWIMELASGINTVNPDDHVYAESGVAVHRSAVGAPVALYDGPALKNLSDTYGDALVRTTQCVPVMTSNPVYCEATGETRIEAMGQISVLGSNLTSPNNDTWYAFPEKRVNLYFQRDLRVDSVMGKWLGSAVGVGPSQEALYGNAIIYFGAVTDPAGETPFASYLAEVMGDPNKDDGLAGGSIYTVTCGINPRRAFEYRAVTLELRARGGDRDSNMVQYLSGSAPCTPANPTIGEKMFATAAVASHFLIKENSGIDGYFNTLARLAGYQRNSTFAFPNSRNYLEDVLGVVSALAAARMELGEGVVATAMGGDNQEAPGRASAEVELTRLGTDSGWALWLLLPPVLSLVVLSYYAVMSVLHHYAPGGTGFSGTSEERPKRYAAESIRELVGLGWAAAARSHHEKLGTTADPHERSSVGLAVSSDPASVL